METYGTIEDQSSSSSVESLHITVTHGPQKHTLDLLETATLGKLFEVLEAVTGVPVDGQKIINRGKTLQGAEKTLTEAGLKNGSKMMLIGKKSSLEEDENFKQIEEVEKKIESLFKKQADIAEEITGVEKGFLQKDLEKESISKLEKRLAACHEEYFKLMEKLDALELSESPPAVRGKRKSVIKEIQKHLDSNDAISTTIQRLKNPEAT